MKSIEEKITKIKQERSDAINSIVGAKESIEEERLEDSLNRFFLEGYNSEDASIFWFFVAYYLEAYKVHGRTFTYPNFTDDNLETAFDNFVSAYNDQFERVFSRDRTDYLDTDSVSTNSGFYAWEDDDTKLASDEMRYQSEWLNLNGENGEEQQGIRSYFNDLDSAIGEEAEFDEDGKRASFDTESEAQEYAENTRGSALLGKRTEDSTVFSETFNEETTWYVGDGERDQPEYYEGSEKNDLLSSISNYISSLENYRDHIIKIKEELQNIENEENEIFEEYSQMKEDVYLDDIQNIENLVNEINDYLGEEEDILSESETLYAYKYFFENATGEEGISDTESDYVFNDELINLKSFDSILSSIESRADEITSTSSNQLGNTSSGDASDFSGLRKLRNFWIEQRILKQKGNYLLYRSMQRNEGSQLKELRIANDKIEALEGDDRSIWILKPKILTVFNDHRRNDSGEILQRRVGMAIDGQQHATRYEFFRKEMNEINISDINEEWNEEETIIGTLEGEEDQKDDGTLKNVFNDLDVLEGNIYLYRGKVVDEENDPYGSSSSRQSDIALEENRKSFSTSNGRIIFEEEHDFSAGDFILILNSASSLNGFHIVSSKSEDELSIEQEVEDNLSGDAYKLNCIVAVD